MRVMIPMIYYYLNAQILPLFKKLVYNVKCKGDVAMNKLLIVVDYQNDFVDGSLGFEGALKIENNIISKIKEFKNNNDQVVFTFDTHSEEYMETMEGKNLPVPHCIKGSNGHKLYGKVANELEGCLSFEKETFGSKELANYLGKNKFDEIVLIGVVTNICVISNAVIAKTMQPNSKIVVDASCCASFNLEMEQKAYDILENLHIKVINR